MTSKIQKSFYKGQLQDDRIQDFSGYSYSENFGIDEPTKLKQVPVASTDGASESYTASWEFTRFVRDNANTLWGLGVDDDSTGDETPRIAYLDGSFDWSNTDTAAAASSLALTRLTTPFVFYKDYIYWEATNTGQKLMRVGAIPSNSIDSSYKSITNSFTGPALIGKDDVLYFPAGATLSSLDNTTFTETVLQFPTDYSTVQLAQFQNLLAIGVNANNTVPCGIYLWDYINADTIDFVPLGFGTLHGIGNLNGMIVAVMSYTSEYGEFIVEIKGYTGGQPVSLKKIRNLTGEVSFVKVIRDRIMFAASNSSQAGIWEFGQVEAGFPYYVNQIYTNSGWETRINDFETLGSRMFVSYTDDAGDIYVDRISSANGAQATINTQWFTPDDPTETQQLKAVSVTHEKIPTNGTVTVKYRADDDASWTTLIVNTNVGDVRTTATFESDGTELKSFKKLKVQVIVASGATPIEVYSIKPDYEPITDDGYGR